MRIALINLRYTNDERELSPLGLGYIAACLEKYYIVDILDRKIGLDLETLISDIGAYSIIGISVYNYNFIYTAQLVKRIKQECPEKIIVVGGYFPSLNTEFVLKSMPVDYVFINEGELTFLEQYPDNKSIREIKGIAYKEDNKIIYSEKRELQYDLNVFPIPVRKTNCSCVPMIVSRGCYEKCIFCSVPYLYKSYANALRIRTVRDVVQEIKYLYEMMSTTCIQFVDNNLLYTIRANQNWIYDFCNQIFQTKIKISMSTYARPKDVVLARDYLNLLRQAGLEEIFLEVQNFQEKYLKYYHKDSTESECINSIKYLKENNIPYAIQLILLNPVVTLSDITYNLFRLYFLRFYNHCSFNQCPLTMMPALFPMRDTYFYDKLHQEDKYRDKLKNKYAFEDMEVNELSYILEEWEKKVEALFTEKKEKWKKESDLRSFREFLKFDLHLYIKIIWCIRRKKYDRLNYEQEKVYYKLRYL